MKVAALDLGTNSFLCLIAEVERQNSQFKIKKVISDQIEIVRLGQSVQKDKKFHDDALKRADLCLAKFRQTIDLYKPEKILAMATSAARDVSNAESFFQICEKHQIPVEIIPGNKEAEITFFGSISGSSIGNDQTVVIDVGGGSTEIIIGSEKQISFSQSADIGAVRITEMFFAKQPPTQEQFQNAKAYVLEKLQFLKEPVQKLDPKRAIAVAGTPTELAKIVIGSFVPEKIDGFRISLGELEDWQNKFLKSNSQERESLYHVSPGRSDIILAGTLILKQVLEILNIKDLSVSTRGVRYGVALELASRSL